MQCCYQTLLTVRQIEGYAQKQQSEKKKQSGLFKKVSVTKDKKKAGNYTRLKNRDMTNPMYDL